jgi:outer membrane protein OmpA-like peptidoglycan-associated protein
MAQPAHAADPHDSHGDHPADVADGPTSGPGGWLLALVLMIATTAIVLWVLLAPRAALPPPPPLAAAPHVVAAEVGALGAMVEHALPGGTRIAVPERGVEGRLLAFIQDASRPADKATWFDFDRLTFETGSASLLPTSHDQLAAVAAILASHPPVKLKIGGYTDNVGDPASNQQLSEQRASNVRAALIQLGVAAERLAAEGYGEQFPVGDNSTPEGRASNRRISLRVVEK